jgi:hypothetical protein
LEEWTFVLPGQEQSITVAAEVLVVVLERLSVGSAYHELIQKILTAEGRRVFLSEDERQTLHAATDLAWRNAHNTWGPRPALVQALGSLREWLLLATERVPQ